MLYYVMQISFQQVFQSDSHVYYDLNDSNLDFFQLRFVFLNFSFVCQNKFTVSGWLTINGGASDSEKIKL